MLIWALIRDMQITRLWLANSTVCHSNDINSTYRETHRERENKRGTERERRRAPLGSLWVSGWLYSIAVPAGVHCAQVFFLYSIAVPEPLNVEIVVMSDPTIFSLVSIVSLVSWPRDTTLFVIATNSIATNLVLSSNGPSQAKVGEAMNTNSPTDVSWWGSSDPIVYASIFFNLLMQAIQVGERFHIDTCICNSEWPIEGVINNFSGNEAFKDVIASYAVSIFSIHFLNQCRPWLAHG